MPWKENHTIIEHAQQLWPYISGLFLMLTAGIKLWWYDRNQTRRLINDNHAVMVKEIRDLREHTEQQNTDLVKSLTDQMIALFNGKS